MFIGYKSWIFLEDFEEITETMAPVDKELEQQIADAGNKLIQPPPSRDELLRLLDQVESSLSKVEQSPAKSMHDALSPLMKALVANDILRHSDVDVKVAVASCISEITRITAPDAPYDDDKMKDVFQLIVSSFENLNDQSSRSYNKRLMILETVAKVRSCVVMLDLECDKLITEMFQHFLKTIREDQDEIVFSSMTTIMTLVLEESEEVSLELLTPLLASVKKDNEEVTPIAKRLGETVFVNCAVKLKPYLAQAVESLQISLNEYSTIVTSVLEGTLPAVDAVNDSAPKDQLVIATKLAELPEAAQATQDGGSKVATASSVEADQMAESAREEACSEDIDPAVNGSPKSITSNGVGLENVGVTAETESLMKAGDHDEVDLHDASKIPSKSESDDSRVEKSTKSEPKATKSEPKSEQPTKKRGRKTISSINSAESSHQAPEGSGEEAEKLQDHQDDRNKDDQSSASEDPAVEQANLLEKEPETNQHAAPKESEEDVKIAPSSPGQSLPEESAPTKGGRPKENTFNQEDSVSKKELEAGSDLEVKQLRRPLKKTPLEPCRKEKGGSTSDTEAKKPKQSGKKIDTKNKSQAGPSVRNKEDSKKRGHGKASQETLPSQVSLDHSVKHDEDNEEEIPRTTAKRKRSSSKGRGSRQVVQTTVPTPMSPDNSTKHVSDEVETHMPSAKKKPSSGKDKVKETPQCDKNLVGKKIKVWWPLDSKFYEGVVGSYNSSKKKFTVNYNDGETEKLNLSKERWELVEDDNMSEEEQVASADAASESHKKKKSRTAEPSPKHEMEASPEGKSKDATAKSGQKSKGKVNLKDGSSKSAGKTDNTTSSKSGDQSKKSTDQSVDTEKPSARSKDVSSTPKSKSRQDTPTTANKSKQETVKASNKSKIKTPQSGSKSSADGMEKKLKSSSSKVKESGSQKEKAANSAKNSDSSTKEKSSSASKEQQNEPKSGKKRARGKN